ncbi:band 7 protein AGAP004871-like [Pollicipes pollicipes]|uniref:band 7 protein AGAP004871-like n=1 Tax=Pollicipes pollicipes TaxID=41117 RepID=UPI001884E4E1|nr:band 7 protein AGAP004871-like [Pollicipes pollicipes]
MTSEGKWRRPGEFSEPSLIPVPPGARPQEAHQPQARPPPRVLGQSDRPVVSNMCELILTVLAWLMVIAFFPLSMFACVRVVQEYERAIIFRLGRLVPDGAQGPGLFLILPCLDKFTCVDLRVVSFDVAPQEILTKDLVTISVDAVVYFRIFEPTVSVTNVENSGYSTRLLAATTLRTVLGQYSLADILSQRESIAHQMQEVLDEATDAWGVKVERVEVKDVRLPQELQRAMAAEAEASREAKAKVIAAEGEMKASRALKDAADIMCASPSALQLRYLQTLNTISAEKNSTIIFPVPIDLLGSLMNGKAGTGASLGPGPCPGPGPGSVPRPPPVSSSSTQLPIIPVRPASVPSVQVSPGLVPSGLVPSGLVQPGRVQPCQVQPGQVQPGQVQPGQVQPGQVPPFTTV